MAPANTARPGLTEVETILVDDYATGYATFQSHNQKVLSNQHGIFMTSIRTRNEKYTAQQWRLLRSTDGGRRFTTVYESTDATNPPVLETDAEGNIYLARPDFVSGEGLLYRFEAARGFRDPSISRMPHGWAGKFSMFFDPQRGRLYYFGHDGHLKTIAPDGTLLSCVKLLQSGQNAQLMYPHLSLARDGALHAAWTTQKHGIYLYWDIHHMLSRDGGAAWQKLDGTRLDLPVAADDTGPTDRVTRADEYDVHTWLSSFMAKEGKLHFVYLAPLQPRRQHYLRYDVASGARDEDIWPEWKGEEISLKGFDGFLATCSSLRDAPLYCVLQDHGRIACLASDDNGATWYDYAIGGAAFKDAYSIGGCREVTAGGWIIGSFTNTGPSAGRGSATSSPQGGAHVYFIRIRAGLASARAGRVGFDLGQATIEFADMHGQPARVRFAAADGTWTEWQEFHSNVAVRIPTRPVRFQLESRLAVQSGILPIPG